MYIGHPMSRMSPGAFLTFQNYCLIFISDDDPCVQRGCVFRQSHVLLDNRIHVASDLQHGRALQILSASPRGIRHVSRISGHQSSYRNYPDANWNNIIRSCKGRFIGLIANTSAYLGRLVCYSVNCYR